MTRLTVDHEHDLYYAEFGNPQGIPLLFMHGGPGSHCIPAHASYLRPDLFRIIQLDQRGCGQSTPHGSLNANTTDDLVQDMQRLREHLGIERWVIYGGSWGAVLALQYAKQFPQVTLGVLLRGAFLGRLVDWQWFALPSGVAQHFPKAYQAMLDAACVPYAHNPAPYYLQRLQTDDEPAYRAALAWNTWEATVMGVTPPSVNADNTTWLASIQRVQVHFHYAVNQFFLGEQGICADLNRLQDIPIYAVHGLQDLACRHSAINELTAQLPNMQVLNVTAGHGLHEQAMQQGLQRITTELAQRLGLV
jgi:proline iminopeptidase